MFRHVLLLLLIMVIGGTTGCASLIVQDTDSWYEATGKVTTRVVLFWPTMMMSEFAIDTYKHANDVDDAEGETGQPTPYYLSSPVVQGDQTPSTVSAADMRSAAL
ncbi:MAG: hypothetical protein U0172_07830 [Nitrospiraceae bacterium]